MPVEGARNVTTVLIPVPGNGGLWWPVKRIDEISFIDPKRRYQETVHTYTNDTSVAREVDVFEISAGDETLQVERINKLSEKDPKERYQEYVREYIGGEVPAHSRYHDAVIFAVDRNGTKDEDNKLTIRRIDLFPFLDPKERYQETYYELNWPDIGDSEYDYSDIANGLEISEPIRLDPYQMIIDMEVASGRYMLVMYGGNKIAAVPMSKVATPQDNVTLQKTLVESSWTFEYVMQLKISTTANVVLTSFKVENGVVSDSVLRFANVDDSLLTSIECADPSSEIFNGSGTAFYDQALNAYTTSGGLAKTGDGPSGGDAYDIKYVGANGEGYSFVGGISHPLLNYPGTASASAAQTAIITASFNSIYDNVQPYTQSVEVQLVVLGPSSGSATVSTGGDYRDFISGAFGTVSQPASISAKIGVFTVENGLAIADFEASTIDTYVQPAGATSGTNTWSFTYRGLSGTTSFPTPPGTPGAYDVYDISEYVFPPSLGTALEDSFVSVEVNGSRTVYTPYGSFASSGNVGGVWHVSNDRHFIQAFYLDGTFYVYLDRTTEYKTPLGAALNIDPNTINGIIFDVKMADILELK